MLITFLVTLLLLSKEIQCFILYNNQYQGISVDGAGDRILTTTEFNGIWLSNNSGLSFFHSNASLSQNYLTGWQRPSMSLDGKIATAILGYSSNEALYLSTDYGFNFRQLAIPFPPNYNLIWQMSPARVTGDGKFILTIPYMQITQGTTINAIILLSSLENAFTTLLTPTASASQVFQESWLGSEIDTISSNMGGSQPIFQVSINMKIYIIKVDIAANTYDVIKSNKPTNPVGMVASDQSGKNVVCTTGSIMNYGSLLLSTNYGQDFAPITTYPDSVVCSISGLALSSDGKIIVAYCPNTLQVSKDAGSTWTTVNFFAKPTSGPNGEAYLGMSSSGNVIATASRSGPLFVSYDLGNTFNMIGLAVPQPTPTPTSLPTMQPTRPTSAPTFAPTRPTPQPTPLPTASPTLAPSASPSRLPSPSPTLPPHPTATPTQSPTGPTYKPTLPPTALPSTCTCPYSYMGSASAQVCMDCLQFACCTYCPTNPAALCQTSTGSSNQCTNAITNSNACSGGSGGGGSGSGGEANGAGGSSVSISVSPGIMSASKIAYITVPIILGTCILLAVLRFLRKRRGIFSNRRDIAPVGVGGGAPTPVVVGTPVSHNPIVGGGGMAAVPSAPPRSNDPFNSTFSQL